MLITDIKNVIIVKMNIFIKELFLIIWRYKVEDIYPIPKKHIDGHKVVNLYGTTPGPIIYPKIARMHRMEITSFLFSFMI